MRAGLVGNDVDRHAAPQQLREDLAQPDDTNRGARRSALAATARDTA